MPAITQRIDHVVIHAGDPAAAAGFLRLAGLLGAIIDSSVSLAPRRVQGLDICLVDHGQALG